LSFSFGAAASAAAKTIVVRITGYLISSKTEFSDAYYPQRAHRVRPYSRWSQNIIYMIAEVEKVGSADRPFDGRPAVSFAEAIAAFSRVTDDGGMVSAGGAGAGIAVVHGGRIRAVA
jgi:hypothetical protein